MVELKIKTANNEIIKEVQEGSILSEILNEDKHIVETVCGGKGTCKKCLVKVEDDGQNATDELIRLTGENKYKKGLRLSCVYKIYHPLTVFLESAMENTAKIMIEGSADEFKPDPIITKKYIELKEPGLEQQTDDFKRVCDNKNYFWKENIQNFLIELPSVLRENNYKITQVFYNNNLICLESGNTEEKLYGIAVDIGTTTVALYLLDLCKGIRIDSYSAMNPQRVYGADVISRIDYSGSIDGKKQLQDAIVSCINKACEYFVKNNRIKSKDIYSMVFAGNTTMMHLLLGVPSKNMARLPFIPAFTDLFSIRAGSLNININESGVLTIMPGVSAYIGADTVAAVLSQNMSEKNENNLLIDIGTNGEIVLGGINFLYSCSTAAGPAFEGANITCGIAGIGGAIDKIVLKDGQVHFTTIDSRPPIGICGSGLVDVTAQLLDKGIVDETGRLLDKDEIPESSEEYGKNILEEGGKKIFRIFKDENTDIYITQKDLRELQNAKAAIAAGVKVLIKNAGINISDINNVLLAGGFGSYIDRKSAVKIGLIPKELEDRITAVGNAAGQGAVKCLFDKSSIEKVTEIKNFIKYIELSSSKDFNDEYIENMFFEV